jgi:tRNA threonylcarbamoyladenosine biosynthesis protein TsaE
MEIRFTDIDTLGTVAREVIAACGEKRVLAFYGEMGAGKTTLIKTICVALGVTDATSSPTFSIVNEYEGGDGKPVYHFDFYRVKKSSEAFDIGFPDYAASGNWCFIEWPELIAEFLPDDVVEIKLQVTGNERVLTMK